MRALKRSISCAAPRPLSTYEIQFIRDRLMDKQYLPLAYFDGATPENNYTPSEPYTLRLYADPRPQDCEAGYLRLLAAMGASSGLLTVSCILALVGAVAELVAGIIGVKNWNKLEKAGTCITWGIIVIVLCVISNILTVVGGGDFSVLNLATGLVIPVLYLIGALQNKKALG